MNIALGFLARLRNRRLESMMQLLSDEFLPLLGKSWLGGKGFLGPRCFVGVISQDGILFINVLRINGGGVKYLVWTCLKMA